MNKRYGKMLAAAVIGFSFITAGSAALYTTPTYAATATSKAANIIDYGQRFLGVPYKFGAESGQTSRFDCSSFTQYVFAHYGVELPRTSIQQSKEGKYVSRSQLQPGDLVFFYSPVHHVAIYMGNDKLLHTFGDDGVTITDLSGTWDSRYTTARRVLPDEQQTTPQETPSTQPDDEPYTPDWGGNRSSQGSRWWY